MSTIVIYTNVGENKLVEIIQKAGVFDVNIDRMNTMNRIDQYVYEIDLFVRNTEQLNKLCLELSKLPYVEKVERVMQ